MTEPLECLLTVHVRNFRGPMWLMIHLDCWLCK